MLPVTNVLALMLVCHRGTHNDKPQPACIYIDLVLQGWYDEILPNITANANTHYKLSAVEKGHKGWEGGFSEGTFEQFAEYVMAVDDFQAWPFAWTCLEEFI